MLISELEEEIKNCKQCKISMKNKKHSCKKHCTIFYMGELIKLGTEAQDKYKTPKKLQAIEKFIKAIALGIEYLIISKKD